MIQELKIWVIVCREMYVYIGEVEVGQRYSVSADQIFRVWKHIRVVIVSTTSSRIRDGDEGLSTSREYEHKGKGLGVDMCLWQFHVPGVF